MERLSSDDLVLSITCSAESKTRKLTIKETSRWRSWHGRFSVTIGELQACLAEVPNPLREEAERQEGTAGISITARPGKSKKDEVDKVMTGKPM